MNFKIGDKLEIAGTKVYHDFDMEEKVKVIRISHSKMLYLVINKKEIDNWVHKDDLK